MSESRHIEPLLRRLDGRVPPIPSSWYYACSVAALRSGPKRVAIGERQYVVFRTHLGEVSALDARCVHLGADLSRGCVVKGGLQCPYHEWTFAADGQCVHIPASDSIPPFARQAAFPTAVRGGHVFIFNGETATFPMPFFEGIADTELRSARPFNFQGDMDWSMIGANGFDLQHFRAAHDRTLVDEPVVDTPAPFARRIRATFAVTGKGWRDRATRLVSGPKVEMSVTSWCGTLICVTATFRRTTTYGLVSITPTAPSRCVMSTIVWVRKSKSALGRAIVDPGNAWVRASFIRAFLRSDHERLSRIRYTPGTLIEADAALGDYFDWLIATASGESWRNAKEG